MTGELRAIFERVELMLWPRTSAPNCDPGTGNFGRCDCFRADVQSRLCEGQ